METKTSTKSLTDLKEDQISQLGTGEILNRLWGQEATLILSNGTSITGRIPEGVDYGSSFTKQVHVTRLTGQEFYDAVIDYRSIVGFTYRRPES